MDFILSACFCKQNFLIKKFGNLQPLIIRKEVTNFVKLYYKFCKHLLLNTINFIESVPHRSISQPQKLCSKLFVAVGTFHGLLQVGFFYFT